MLLNQMFDVMDHQFNSCWKASISDAQAFSSFHRFIISSCGSRFEVLYGRCPEYRWLFLPQLEIGCMLSDPSDLFWNSERLGSLLNRKDTLTIVYAIRFIGDIHA